MSNSAVNTPSMIRWTTCLGCNHSAAYSAFIQSTRAPMECPICKSTSRFATNFVAAEPTERSEDVAKGDKKKAAQDVEREFQCEFGGYSRGNKTSGIGVRIAIPSSKEAVKRSETIAMLDRLFCNAQGKATLSYDPAGDKDVAGQTTMVDTSEECIGVADVHSISFKATTASLKLSFNRDDEPDTLRDFSCSAGTLRFERTGELSANDGEGDDA